VGAPTYLPPNFSKFNFSKSKYPESNSFISNFSIYGAYACDLAGSSIGPSPVALDGGGPLRLWEPLSTRRIQPWLQFRLPWPHLWLVPPLGPALGPLRGWPLRLWEPLSTFRVQSWQQFLPD